ncbi:CIS tube protein [Kribbella endophytica]
MTDPIALKASGGGGGAAPAEEKKSLQKAKLKLFDPTKEGSQGQDRGEIPFQFNPKEVTIQKSAKWERKPAKKAKSAGPPEFSGAEPCKLTVEMFFDASGNQDNSVVTAVEKLFSCCVPTEESRGKDKPTPPLVMLQWGKIASFPAFVTSVSVKYTLFSADGVPIRAVCSVAMEEMPNEPWRQNPTSGGQSVRRSHRMIDGDSLASLAYTEYGDPGMWRTIARYNGIDDPMRLPSGSVVVFPAAEELV